MPASEVGVELMLSLTWPTGTDAVPFTVPETEETVDLAFTRTVNNATVQQGDSVKLTYNLKNNGTAVISNLNLTDTCVPGTILSGLTLNPGESKQVTSTIAVNQATNSVPTAQFTANSTAHSETLDTLTIQIANAVLSVTATADKTEPEAGETVVFTITIRNDSPVAVSGIKVTDDLGTIIRSSASISATTGSTPRTLDITYETPVMASRPVSFTIAYPSGTQTVQKTSEPILLNVIGVVPGVSPLSLTVSASPLALTFPGEVTFTVQVQNVSGQTISGIGVSETALGNVGSILSLAPGGQQTITKKATLQSAGAFSFVATGTDALGGAIEPATAQVVVTSAVGTPTPQTVEPEPTDTLSTLFIVMIAIVVLIVLAGITLVVLLIQEKHSRGKGPKGGGGGRTRRRRTPEPDWDDDESFMAGPVSPPREQADRRRQPAHGQRANGKHAAHIAHRRVQRAHGQHAGRKGQAQNVFAVQRARGFFARTRRRADGCGRRHSRGGNASTQGG